jgi:hypothetical protein
MVGIIPCLRQPLSTGCAAALGLSDSLLLDKSRGRSANEIRRRAFCRFAHNRRGRGSGHCRGSHFLQCTNADELSSSFGWCMRWNASRCFAVRLYAFSAPTTDLHPAIPRVDSHNSSDVKATGAWHNFSDRPRHSVYSCGTAAAGGAIKIIRWDVWRVENGSRSRIRNARAPGHRAVQSTDFTPVPIGRRSLSKGHGRNGRAILCAFDLLEVNGEDVRQEPIEDRKRRLAGLLRPPHDGIALNEHALPIGQELRAGD